MKIFSSTSASAKRSDSGPARVRRRFRRTLAGLAGGLALLLAGGWGWLQSPAGRAWTLARVSALLSGPGGQQVVLEGLHGRVPVRIRIDRVAVSDRDGEWLTVKNAALEWSPAAWIGNRRVVLERFTASDIRVSRRPTIQTSGSPGGGDRKGAPWVPPIEVRAVEVSRFHIQEPVLGSALEGSITGRCEILERGRHFAAAVHVREFDPGNTSLRAEVTYDVAEQALTADIEANIAAASGAATLLHIQPAGVTSIRVAGEGSADNWQGTLEGRTSQWGNLDAALELGWRPDLRLAATGRVEVVAPPVQADPITGRFSVAVERTTDKAWIFQPTLSVPGWRVGATADMVYDPDSQRLTGSAEATAPSLLPATESLGYPVEGSATIDVRLEGHDSGHALGIRLAATALKAKHGSVEHLQLEGRLEDLRDLETLTLTTVANGAGAGNLRAESLGLEISRDGPALDTRLTAEGTWEDPFQLAADGALTPAANEWTFALDTLRVRWGDWAIATPIPCTITATTERVSWSPFQIEGAGFSATVTGQAAADSVDLAADLAVQSLADLPLPMAGLPSSSLRAGLSLAGSPSAPEIQAVVHLDQVLPTALLDRGLPEVGLTARATLRAGRLAAEATLDDHPVRNVAVRFEAPAHLSLAPFAFEYADDTVLQAALQMDVGLEVLGTLPGWTEYEPTGRLTADVTWTGPPKDIQMAGDVHAVDWTLKNLPAPWGSLPARRLDGRLRLAGSLETPSLETEWSLRPAAAPDSSPHPPLTDLSLQAALTDGQLSATLTTPDDSPFGLSADLHVPLDLSLLPYRLVLADKEPLALRADADLDLALLKYVKVLNNQQLEGHLSASFSCSGPRETLVWDGRARLDNGSYEHLLFGTLFRDLSGTLVARDRTLTLESLEGTDGDAGRIAATGSLILDPDAGFPIEGELRAERATLIRQDHLTASASARLDLAGSIRQPVVTGSVSVVSGEFNIDRLPPSPPPTVEIRMADRTSPAPTSTTAPPSSSMMSGGIQGTVRISLDGPIFVRGAGLESTWGGSVALTSKGGPWKTRGVLRPRRGTYEFFGRRFSLVRSSVVLDGGLPVVPTLDITAEYERPEIRTRLRITGPLTQPTIDLESDPDYPRDEILAQTMFGTSASGLTPLQTAQLATAVAGTARRRESAFDFMGRARSRLRVDALGLRENSRDPSQVDLVAGTFVTDRLFLEYSQRVGGARETGVRAEFDINRHLSLETNAGAQLRPGVRLNIKMDY